MYSVYIYITGSTCCLEPSALLYQNGRRQIVDGCGCCLAELDEQLQGYVPIPYTYIRVSGSPLLIMH